MKKTYIIIDQDGDIYCAAETLEIAEKIIKKDVSNGDLESGTIQDANLHGESDV